MNHFNEEDKTLLYIIRSIAVELKGSWDDCTAIFNRLTPHYRTQDALTTVYRSLDKSKLEAKARTIIWDQTKEQVRKWLTEKKSSPQRNLVPRSNQLDAKDDTEVVCPTPKHPSSLLLSEWNGTNAPVNLGVHTDPFWQHSSLPKEQAWAANSYAPDGVLWPRPAADFFFAGSTATELNVDNKPTHREDSLTMYNTGNWDMCGVDRPCLYGDSSYVSGDSSYMSGDSSYMYGDSLYTYRDRSYMHEDSTCIYGTDATYTDTPDSLDMFAINSTSGATIGSSSNPSYNTAIESYSITATTPTNTATTTTTPIHPLGNQNYYVPNSSTVATSSYTASSSVNHEPIPTDSPSQPSSFAQVVPINTSSRSLDTRQIGITNAATLEEKEGLMSSEELSLLLEKTEPFFRFSN